MTDHNFLNDLSDIIDTRPADPTNGADPGRRELWDAAKDYLRDAVELVAREAAADGFDPDEPDLEYPDEIFAAEVHLDRADHAFAERLAHEYGALRIDPRDEPINQWLHVLLSLRLGGATMALFDYEDVDEIGGGS